jgi:DNA primase large subunit
MEIEQLVFAQKFPFTEKAKHVLKGIDINISEIPEPVIRKAALIISRANSRQEYLFDAVNATKEMLENEIMAFPTAKLLVSSMRTTNVIEKFCDMIRKKTFNEIVNSDDAKEFALNLADDFDLNIGFGKEFSGGSFEVSLLDYLKINFVDDETKLVNKLVEKGMVFLNLNDFARFLSEKAYAKIFVSLPIKKENVPKEILKIARSIDSQLVKIEHKRFDARLAGKVNPNFFPPSMQNLYENQLAGKKLSYYDRLVLVSFLYQIGMKKQELLVLFSKSPDFKKHIAEYHINRVFERELSAPGYKKISEYGIIVSKEEKVFRHPVQYYLRKLRANNRIKNNAKTNEGGNKNV